MTDPLPITPFRRPVCGSVELPGSKSITNRALILAALAEGTTTLTGVLFSRDTALMIEALRSLAVEIDVDHEARSIRVAGTGGRWAVDEATIHVGNAGTAARFLTALFALHPTGNYRLDGDPPMRERPMAALLDALGAQGTNLEFGGEAGHLPFAMQTSGLSGGEVTLDAGASSQFVSALLMAAPYGRKDLQLRVDRLRPAFVRITTEMMAQFGVAARIGEDGTIIVPAGQPFRSPGIYAVEPDVTASSYFQMLPLVAGGSVRLPGLTDTLLQGDAAFAKIVRALGATVTQSRREWLVEAQPIDAPSGLDRDFHHFSDTFLTLAAVSPLCSGPTTIRGIAHTRKQETDRVAAMANELRKLGCCVDETEGSLHITPDPEALLAAATAGVTIDTYEDHRFAMSFGILGCADLRGDQSPWLSIADPACCGKTFPEFFNVLAALHASSHA